MLTHYEYEYNLLYLCVLFTSYKREGDEVIEIDGVNNQLKTIESALTRLSIRYLH